MTRARLPFWAALAALFCAGLIAAFGSGSGNAAGTTTDDTLTLPTTVPQTTVQQTTVQVTLTQTQVTTTSRPGTIVVTQAPTTDTSSSTKTWALVAIGVAIFALIALIAWLASRHKDLPADARRRMLAQAVAAWVAQGWAPVSQTDTTAILRRGDEQVVLSVDGRGNISSQPVGAPPPTAGY
jgi:hypothetical protein